MGEASMARVQTQPFTNRLCDPEILILRDFHRPSQHVLNRYPGGQPQRQGSAEADREALGQ